MTDIMVLSLSSVLTQALPRLLVIYQYCPLFGNHHHEHHHPHEYDDDQHQDDHHRHISPELCPFPSFLDTHVSLAPTHLRCLLVRDTFEFPFYQRRYVKS